MDKNTTEFSPLVYARIAGIIGVFTLISGTFPSIVDSRLIVPGEAVKTASNILMSEFLFRLGIVSSLFMHTFLIFYALILFKLLKPVSKTNAQLMVIFIVIPLPMYMATQLVKYTVLQFSIEGLHDHILLFWDIYKHGGYISGIFWGIWLFPLGFLIYRSGFIPRFLGVFLIIGCFGYLIRFFQAFLFPGSEASIWTNPALVVTHLSELSLMCWLLIKGVNIKQWQKYH